jgi:hypothetical protein
MQAFDATKALEAAQKALHKVRTAEKIKRKQGGGKPLLVKSQFLCVCLCLCVCVCVSVSIY